MTTPAPGRWEALEQHEAELFGIVCTIASAARVMFDWNVCKLSPYRPRVQRAR